MKSLTKLFTLAELTREQTQYGYILGGVKSYELSNLAEHHYLVTFVAWQLAAHLIAKGAKLDLAKVMELSMIHDFGELMGGDISMIYAKANPEARKLAKAFEEENQKFIGKYFGAGEKHFNELSAEIMSVTCDEGIIAKMADYIEVTHFKRHIGKFEHADITLIVPKMEGMADKASDPIIKTALKSFIEQWQNEVGEVTPRQVIEGM